MSPDNAHELIALESIAQRGLESLAVEGHLQVIRHAAVNGNEIPVAALDVHHPVHGHACASDEGSARLDNEPAPCREPFPGGRCHCVQVLIDSDIRVVVGVALREASPNVIDLVVAKRR